MEDVAWSDLSSTQSPNVVNSWRNTWTQTFPSANAKQGKKKSWRREAGIQMNGGISWRFEWTIVCFQVRHIKQKGDNISLFCSQINVWGRRLQTDDETH